MKKIMIMLALVALAVSSQADMVLIDLGTGFTSDPNQNGLTNYWNQGSGSGGTWNNVGNRFAIMTNNAGLLATNQSGGLITFTQTGKATGITLGGSTWTTSGPTNPVGNFVTNAMKDFISVTAATAGGAWVDFTFSNLTSTAKYELILFGGRQSGAYSADFTVGGTTITLNQSLNYTNVAKFVDLTPNGNNAITFRMANTAASGNALLAAVQLTEVIPEPATVGMLGLGAITTLLIRRFRRA